MADLPIHVPHQRGDFWCWAAVTAAIANFRHAASHDPCDVASQIFPGLSCCPDNEACDEVHELDDVLSRFSLLREPRRSGTLTPTEIADEIVGLGRPVACRIIFRSGPVHYVAITGVDGERIRVQDPNGPVNQQLDWLELVNNYPGDGFWDETYLID